MDHNTSPKNFAGLLRNGISTSPRYPQSNGLAESSVKTVKLMMKKCLATGRDIHQGLLAIRNTPLASPAELLINESTAQ